jgi:hypothetical protein
MSRRTLENCEQYKQKLKALLENESTEAVDAAFVQKNLVIQDTYRNLDIILFQAQVKAATSRQSVIISMGQNEFSSLRFCASCKYYTDAPQDPASLDTADRIVRHQQTVRQAFENAETKARVDTTPNHPAPPSGLLN